MERTTGAGLQPSRLQIALWLTLLLATTALVLWDFDSHPAMTADSGAYTVLAESFFSPEGYGVISNPEGSSPSRFPFIYPLVLAPLVILAPGNFELLRLPSLLATLVNVGLLFWGWRWLSRRSYWWGLAVTALFALSPTTVLQARLVLSEAVFTTFLLGTIILVEYGVRRRRQPWWFVVTGVLIFATVYTRSVGWVMLAGLLAYLLYRWRRRFWGDALRLGAVGVACAAAAVVLTPIETTDLISFQYVTMYVHETTTPNNAPAVTALAPPGSFLAPSPQLLARASDHVWRDIASVIVPGLHSDALQALARALGLGWLPRLVGFVVAGLLAWGALRWLHQDGLSAFMAVVLPYLPILLLWTWVGPLLLYPVQPQLFLAFLFGLEGVLLAAARLLPISARPVARAWGLRATVAMLLVISVLVSALYPPNRGYEDFLIRRSQWIREHTQPNDILMSNIPSTDFLYTRRKALSYGAALASTSPDSPGADLHDPHVTYVLIDRILGGWETSGDGMGLTRTSSYRSEAQAMLQRLEPLLRTGVATEVPVPEEYLFRTFKVQ